jgi:hypothetical protein
VQQQFMQVMAAPEDRLADSGACLASDAGEQDVPSADAGAAGAAPAATAGVTADEKPLPALFLDSMPEDTDAHPDLAGLNTMMGELTAEERAENEKVCGNGGSMHACLGHARMCCSR